MNYEEICAWCGYKLGLHQGGNTPHCVVQERPTLKWDSHASFVELDKLTLDRVPFGSRVEVYVDEDNDLIPMVTMRMIPATLVGKSPSGSLVLAWKSSETTPANAWPIFREDLSKYPFLSGYQFGRFVGVDHRLHRIVQLGTSQPDRVAVKPAGMACAIVTCQEFNDYAQPNHGDLHICWSCRDAGYHRIPSLLKS